MAASPVPPSQLGHLQFRPLYDADLERIISAVSFNEGTRQLVETAAVALDVPHLARTILNTLGQNALVVVHRGDAPSFGTQRRLFSDTSQWRGLEPQVEKNGSDGLTQIYIVPLPLVQKNIHYKFGEISAWAPQAPNLEQGPNRQTMLDLPLTIANYGRIPPELEDPRVLELTAKEPESATLLKTAHLIVEHPEIEHGLVQSFGKVITIVARMDGIAPASYHCRLVGAFTAEGTAQDFWKFTDGIQPLTTPTLEKSRIFVVHIPPRFSYGTLEYKFVVQNPASQLEQWSLGENIQIKLVEKHLFCTHAFDVKFTPVPIPVEMRAQPQHEPLRRVPFAPTQAQIAAARQRAVPLPTAPFARAPQPAPHAPGRWDASASLPVGFTLPPVAPQDQNPSQSCAQQ